MKLFRTGSALSLPILTGLALSCAAQAGTLTGVVVDQGKPLAGAMVTAFTADAKRRDTVYTNASGRYRLNVDFAGELTVRARTPYFKDASVKVSLPLPAVKTLDFSLERHSVAAELSDSLPASAHAAVLPWGNHNTREAFISQCNYCHQMGNALTRVPREESRWRDTVRRMEGYFAMLTNREADDITKALHAGFDGKPVPAVQHQPWQPQIAPAKIKEWVAGDAATFIHDTEVGHDDDLYGMDFDDGENPDTFRVLYHAEVIQDESALQAPPPMLRDYDDLLPHHPDESYPIVFELAEEVAAMTDYRFYQRFGAGFFQQFGEKEWDIMDEFGKAVRPQGHKVGGYAYFTQDDPRRPEDPMLLLFQLDSDQRMDLMWGDMGVGHFFIREKDLIARDFSRVLYDWDCL